MSEKNYPYKSKVVLTEKQASKEPIGSYYHPTEKTFRSGACPVGMTLQKGYHRKGYMKMNGTVINNTNVDPVCVKNKGLPGKLLKKEKDDFKEFGYLTSSNNNIRFKSLLEACKVLSYGTVMRKLNILKKKSSKKEDNKSKKLYNIYSSDILMLQKWRMKNPDLYKVKSELLLVGGQILSFFYSKINVNDEQLRKIIGKIKSSVDSNKKFNIRNHYKLSNLVVSEITDTSNLFNRFDFKKATELGYDVNISKWKLKKVKNMSGMFIFSKGFNQDLSSWGSSLDNVQYMSGLFTWTSFNQDLSSWGPYLKNVKDMSKMFKDCKSFNQNLSSWGPYLDSVRYMSEMFAGCINFNQDLSSWKLSKVTTMEFMFYNCESFDKDLSSWGPHLGSVTKMKKMFAGCINFNQDLSSWELSKVTTMEFMFEDCKSFNQDLSSWKLSEVTTMELMFYNCESFNQDLSSWGPHLGEVTNMSYMFYNCKIFEGKGLDKWGPYLKNVKYMSSMFKDCINFNQDLSSWGQSLDSVQYMSEMFAGCINFNQDLSSWGPFLGNVTNMEGMFKNCKSFKQDLSSWAKYLKIKNSEYMLHGIFNNCNNINLKKWKETNPNININIMK